MTDRPSLARALSTAATDALEEAGEPDAARAARWWAWKVEGAITYRTIRPAGIMGAGELARVLRAIGREELAEVVDRAFGIQRGRGGTLTIDGVEVAVVSWETSTGVMTVGSSISWSNATSSTPVADFNDVREATREYGELIQVNLRPLPAKPGPLPGPPSARPLSPSSRGLAAWLGGRIIHRPANAPGAARGRSWPPRRAGR